MKTVYKPWGKEVWLELNEKYCYKRIYINAGTKTSYQYHVKKLETNYIIEGEAEVWLENDENIVEKKVMKAGDFFTVHPPKRHRVIAITDIILQEVSTPEVDDVIRIDDDSSRSSGKIEHEHLAPALCILAAGTGSRLKHYSKHINKALLPLNNQAIISHLISKVPIDYDIVVLVGYKSELVKEYCQAAHPKNKFIFVDVDDYQGVGTGPGYSIKFAEKYLQRPFIWAAADTVITNDIPKPDHDWIGLYPTSMPELYSTVNIKNGDIIDFKNKSRNGFDFAFIGLSGVYNYKTFWEQIEGPEIVSAYYKIQNYDNIKSHHFDWYDVGTTDNYYRAKKVFEKEESYGIAKTNGEFLYKVEDMFIKLSSNESFIKGRVGRAKILEGLVPNLDFEGQNIYAYKWVNGATLYDLDDIEIWKQFLDFLKIHLWKPINQKDDKIKELCNIFYKEKTLARLKKFLSSRDSWFREEHYVNGLKTRKIESLINDFDWDKLMFGLPTKLFHGDLQFDNVLFTKKKSFQLIDWRQDFAGGHIGDVYYDLAKMYGGILMSYKLMKDENNFHLNIENVPICLPCMIKILEIYYFLFQKKC